MPATNNESDSNGQPTEDDRYANLIERSDSIAEAAVGSGRMMMGIECLEGYDKPTALIVVVGDDLPVGEHEGVSETSRRVVLRVFDEDMQDLPAGSTYYGAQTGFDAPAEYTFDSLGVSLSVDGC